MSLIQTIIIAIIEGITEFLPISSTAHMKFANPLIGVHQNAFTDLFEIVIQLAAILSVVVLYYKQFFDFKKIGFYLKLVIALIPAIIAGVLLKKHIDAMLGNLVFIASVMIAGGIVLLFIDKLFSKPLIHSQDGVSNKNAFVIGFYQVLSVLFPGLSRSAATIIGGLQQKLDRRTAAEFSFFLAVPTMLAASAKSFWDVHKANPEVFVKDNMTLLIIGSLVAFVVALLAIRFFITYLQRHGFRIFGYYRILAGSLIIFLVWKGIIHQ
ncbi:MAG: undecaprenyl-diphosphate phosphatase [Bacteroidota bacterium]|nr:undecaprenyl-diphosphate phosphatase [Bacteroidota bacterium]